MTIYLDVHGTLVATDEATLRPGAAELLQALHEAGHEVTLWSTGGSGYASRFARLFGLQPWVTETLTKTSWQPAPDVCVDDSSKYLVGSRLNVKVTIYLGDPGDTELLRAAEAIAALD